MYTSYMDNKLQVTIPQAVRQCLALHPGSQIKFTIIDQQVTLTKLHEEEILLSEWHSKADDEAFKHL